MSRRGRRLAVLWTAMGLLGASAAGAQVAADTTGDRLVEVTADSLSRFVLEDEAVALWIGNVEGQQDSTFLAARRVLQYLERDEYLFSGDVLIIERGDSLRADTVFYNERTKVGRAQGRVFLTDGEVRVRAPSGLYFSREKRTRFDDGVTLMDSTATLTSERGTYWSDDKRAELDGTVRLNAERTALQADSITYYRETEVSIARGNVFLARIGGEDEDPDSTLRTLLFSQYAYNDEQAQLSRVRGRPLLIQLRQDSTDAPVDTLLIRALRLESIQQDSLQRLIAVDSVQIWQRDFAARADSVVYERIEPPLAAVLPDTTTTSPPDTLAPPPDSLMGSPPDAAPPDAVGASRREETRLFGRPIAWVDEAQVTGDTLRVTGHEGTIDTLFVRQRAFVAQRDTVLERIQQLKGLHLVGVFEGDSTRIFTVGPNAEVIFFQRDDEDRPDGGLRASGDRAVFRVRGETPERITFTGEPQGTYYAEDLLPTPFQLDGFRWEPDGRPTPDALMDDAWIRERLAAYAAPPPIQTPFERVPPAPEAPAPGTGDGAAPASEQNR